MYARKYWRETRIAFGIGIVGIFILFVLISKEQNLVISGNPPFDQFARLFPAPFFVQAVPVSFFAWLIGSAGVGRDLGQGDGSRFLSLAGQRAGDSTSGETGALVSHNCWL